MEGEAKGEGHGDGGGGSNAPAVPMRRWEDWERSRLRKLKREERRRREMERAHPGGFIHGDREYLTAPDRRSWSDSQSLASSDDDHWGTQIGAYNEHSGQYPLPPVGLVLPRGPALENAETVGGAELEAMLEQGFEDRRASPPDSTYVPRYQLVDGSTTHLTNVDGNGYAPLMRSASPGVGPPQYNPRSPTTPSSESGHSRPLPPPGGARAADRYGPLGPLDPSTSF